VIKRMRSMTQSRLPSTRPSGERAAEAPLSMRPYRSGPAEAPKVPAGKYGWLIKGRCHQVLHLLAVL
jgi:hypothetical protein